MTEMFATDESQTTSLTIAGDGIMVVGVATGVVSTRFPFLH